MTARDSDTTEDDTAHHDERLVEMLANTERYPSQLDVNRIRLVMEHDSARAADATSRTTLAELHARLDLHASLVAPIRKLPDELLAEIFEWSMWHYLDDVSGYYSWGADTVPHGAAVAKPLMLTSRRWRRVAISWPTLWTHLAVGGSGVDSEEKAALCAAAFRAWVPRSGGLPLQVRLGSNDSVLAPALGLPLLRQNDLNGFAARVTCFELHLPGSLLSAISELTPLPFLALEKLRLYIVSEPRIDGPLGPTLDVVAFQNAPVVDCTIYERDVHLHGRYSVRWQTVTKLKLRLSVAESLRIMRYCEMLQECELQTPTESANLPGRDVVHLPQLRTLEICAYSSVDELFSCMSTPTLEELELDEAEELLLTLHANPFISFLERSNCTMQRLAIINPSMTDSDFTRCLEHMPHLTSLTLAGSHSVIRTVTNRLLRSLTAGGTRTLLPRLKELRLNMYPPYKDHIILGMIQSRWSTDAPLPGDVSRLASVALCLHGPPLSSQVIQELDRITSEGLDITAEFVYDSEDEDDSEDDEA